MASPPLAFRGFALPFCSPLGCFLDTFGGLESSPLPILEPDPFAWARLASLSFSLFLFALLFGRKSESSNPPPSFAVVTELKPS